LIEKCVTNVAYVATLFTRIGRDGTGLLDI